MKMTHQKTGDATPIRDSKLGARAISVFGLAALPFVMSAPAATATGTLETLPDGAFADSGYSLADAQVLDDAWSQENGIILLRNVEAKASAYLKATGTLRNTEFSDEDAADSLTDAEAREYFRDSGKTQADADVLAKAWGVSSSEAEVKGGSDLKALGILPFMD